MKKSVVVQGKEAYLEIKWMENYYGVPEGLESVHRVSPGSVGEMKE